MPSTASITPAKASSLKAWLDTVVALTSQASSRKRCGSLSGCSGTRVLVTYSRPGVLSVLLRKPTMPKLTRSSSPRLAICSCRPFHLVDLIDIGLHRHRGVHHQHDAGAKGIGPSRLGAGFPHLGRIAR